MADNDTLPLECSDPVAGQSVPCPDPSTLPGPTCDPDGQLPQLANEPAQPEVLTVQGPNTDPSCWNPKIGYAQTPGDTPGVTKTGPGIQARIGECGTDDQGKLVRGSFDLNAEASLGKVTYKTPGLPTTGEIEGPNARAGIAINPKGESRIGAQANVASESAEIAGANGSLKVGLSQGVGAEVRTHSGALSGNGFDLGPFSYDGKHRMAVQ